jgi:hypothetical protein
MAAAAFFIAAPKPAQARLIEIAGILCTGHAGDAGGLGQ